MRLTVAHDMQPMTAYAFFGAFAVSVALAAPGSPSFLTPIQQYRDGPRTSPASRVHITEKVSAQLLTRKVAPQYPLEALNKRIEGDVVFSVVVGTDGRVHEIHLRRGNPLLVEGAAKAVSQWRYTTYALNGNPVEVETFATAQFRLKNDQGTVNSQH
jgi:TonB family protein